MLAWLGQEHHGVLLLSLDERLPDHSQAVGPDPEEGPKDHRCIIYEALAQQQYAISNLSHRHTVAATTVLFKMHTPGPCPVDLKALLPQAHT